VATITLFVVEEFSPIPALMSRKGPSTAEKLQFKVSGLDLVFRKMEGLSGHWKALNGAENQVLSPFQLSPISWNAKDP